MYYARNSLGENLPLVYLLRKSVSIRMSHFIYWWTYLRTLNLFPFNITSMQWSCTLKCMLDSIFFLFL